MPTLSEHNAIIEATLASSVAVLNGIDCDNCGSELLDLYLGKVFRKVIPGYPDETFVKCSSCSFTGVRFVDNPYKDVIHHADKWISDDTIKTYTFPADIDGIEITELTFTITPQKVGNKLKIETSLFCNSNRDTVSQNYGFVWSRNDVILPYPSNADTDVWAVVATPVYDSEGVTTPQKVNFTIIDENTLGVASEYKLLVRSTGGLNGFLYYNSSDGTIGADYKEVGVSTVVMTEQII